MRPIAKITAAAALVLLTSACARPDPKPVVPVVPAPEDPTTGDPTTEDPTTGSKDCTTTAASSTDGAVFTTSLGLGAPPATDSAPRAEDISFRIYQGGGALEATYPYVGAFFSAFGGREQLCTGTLICSNVVLSAAHCFFENGSAGATGNQNAPLSAYHFTLAAALSFTGAASDANTLPSAAAAVVSVTVVPTWQGVGHAGSVASDMALVRLAAPLAAALAPLNFDALPEPEGDHEQQATAVGYGEAVQNYGSRGTYGAGTKRVGGLYYEGIFPAYGGHAADAGTLLTLRGKDGQDTCAGDSGGPLIVKDKVSGVLSGGDSHGCGEPLGTVEGAQAVQGYSFYSSVAYNSAWIQAQMKELCGTTQPSPVTTPHKTTACSVK